MSMSGGKPACERWAASLPLCLTGAAAVEQLQEHASCSGCNAQNFAFAQLRQAIAGSRRQLAGSDRDAALRALVVVARGAQQTKAALALATVLSERSSPSNILIMDLIATKIASSDDLTVFCSLCEALTKLARDPVCMREVDANLVASIAAAQSAHGHDAETQLAASTCLAALFSSASSASLSQAALRQGLFENIITHSLKSHRSSYPVATAACAALAALTRACGANALFRSAAARLPEELCSRLARVTPLGRGTPEEAPFLAAAAALIVALVEASDAPEAARGSVNKGILSLQAGLTETAALARLCSAARAASAEEAAVAWTVAGLLKVLAKERPGLATLRELAIGNTRTLGELLVLSGETSDGGAVGSPVVTTAVAVHAAALAAAGLAPSPPPPPAVPTTSPTAGSAHASSNLSPQSEAAGTPNIRASPAAASATPADAQQQPEGVTGPSQPSRSKTAQLEALEALSAIALLSDDSSTADATAARIAVSARAAIVSLVPEGLLERAMELALAQEQAAGDPGRSMASAVNILYAVTVGKRAASESLLRARRSSQLTLRFLQAVFAREDSTAPSSPSSLPSSPSAAAEYPRTPAEKGRAVLKAVWHCRSLEDVPRAALPPSSGIRAGGPPSLRAAAAAVALATSLSPTSFSGGGGGRGMGGAAASSLRGTGRSYRGAGSSGTTGSGGPVTAFRSPSYSSALSSPTSAALSSAASAGAAWGGIAPFELFEGPRRGIPEEASSEPASGQPAWAATMDMPRGRMPGVAAAAASAPPAAAPRSFFSPGDGADEKREEQVTPQWSRTIAAFSAAACAGVDDASNSTSSALRSKSLHSGSVGGSGAAAAGRVLLSPVRGRGGGEERRPLTSTTTTTTAKAGSLVRTRWWWNRGGGGAIPTAEEGLPSPTSMMPPSRGGGGGGGGLLPAHLRRWSDNTEESGARNRSVLTGGLQNNRVGPSAALPAAAPAAPVSAAEGRPPGAPPFRRTNDEAVRVKGNVPDDSDQRLFASMPSLLIVQDAVPDTATDHAAAAGSPNATKGASSHTVAALSLPGSAAVLASVAAVSAAPPAGPAPVGAGGISGRIRRGGGRRDSAPSAAELAAMLAQAASAAQAAGAEELHRSLASPSTRPPLLPSSPTGASASGADASSSTAGSSTSITRRRGSFPLADARGSNTAAPSMAATPKGGGGASSSSSGALPALAQLFGLGKKRP